MSQVLLATYLKTSDPPVLNFGPSDTLGYKHSTVSYGAPTMQDICKVLASQYDPLGFILPDTTRAKMLVRRLWNQHRGWDDPQLPPELLHQWRTREDELAHS